MSVPDTQALITDACRTLRILLMEYLACFKHSGFKEEQEWRIVHNGDVYEDDNRDRVEFRPSVGMLAPYVKLDCGFIAPPHWGKLPIDSVMHGPTQHPELAKEALRLLLIKHKYDLERVKIRGSEVPLRA